MFVIHSNKDLSRKSKNTITWKFDIKELKAVKVIRFATLHHVKL